MADALQKRGSPTSILYALLNWTQRAYKEVQEPVKRVIFTSVKQRANLRITMVALTDSALRSRVILQGGGLAAQLVPPVNQQAYRMEGGQLWRQYIIAGIANIAVASVGYSMGWTSPVVLKLEEGESPLPEVPDTDQIAWITSLLNIGAIVGPFIAGFLASKIGRKWSSLSISIPLFIGWVLIAVASNVTMVYMGRVFWGISVGMAFTLTPMYCAEIATNDARGALGSFVQLFVTMGFLLVYAVGPWATYSVIAIVGTVLTSVFVLAFFFMPETPFYHLTKGDVDSAGESLATLRGCSRAGVQAELDAIAADVKASMEKQSSIADVFRGNNFKAFYISCALLFFQQFSGINAVLFNMTTIFNAAGAGIEPDISTIIVGAVQVCASAVTPFVVDRLGRRLLLLISSCGTAIGHALLAMYFMLADNESPVVDNIGFLPLLALILFIITYCLGLGPLPWAVMAELMPMEVKVLATPIATAFCWVLSFLITRFFGTVADAMGMGPTFLVFGGCCVASFVFSLLVVPETKGKSFQEIQDMMSGKPDKKTEKA